MEIEMSQKLTEKQFLKRQTTNILQEILKGLVSPEEALKVTKKGVYNQFPKSSHYKDNDTGVIKVGLSFRGVRKLLKKNPYITVGDVKLYFGIA